MDESNIVIYWTIVMGIVCFIGMIIGIRREKNIYKYGIEVEAVVTDYSSCKTDKDIIVYDNFVEYVGDDNQRHKAILNCRAHFSKGTKLKVKYLSGKYDYVVVSIIDER